jgi:hypothetical protein
MQSGKWRVSLITCVGCRQDKITGVRYASKNHPSLQTKTDGYDEEKSFMNEQRICGKCGGTLQAGFFYQPNIGLSPTAAKAAA